MTVLGAVFGSAGLMYTLLKADRAENAAMYHKLREEAEMRREKARKELKSDRVSTMVEAEMRSEKARKELKSDLVNTMAEFKADTAAAAALQDKLRTEAESRAEKLRAEAESRAEKAQRELKNDLSALLTALSTRWEAALKK